MTVGPSMGSSKDTESTGEVQGSASEDCTDGKRIAKREFDPNRLYSRCNQYRFTVPELRICAPSGELLLQLPHHWPIF
jgi:hypothetical protein